MAKRISAAGSGLSAEDVTFQDCLEQAEICCEQARGAARCRRFRAARGLFSTAAALYRRALALDGISYPAIEERLRYINTELSSYSDYSEPGKTKASSLVERAAGKVSSTLFPAQDPDGYVTK